MYENMELPGLSPVPKKRGRPRSAVVLTAAERKSKQRQKSVYLFCLNANELHDVAFTTLIEAVNRAFAKGLKSRALLFLSELARRAETLERVEKK